ncbi:MAG: SulP family inorganic anion transporter [Eubacteriales bacterium]
MKISMKKPTIIQSLKQYSFQRLQKEVFAGIMVAIVALPLSIALSIASGVNPEIGLYTGIVGGIVVAIFSGSPVQIGGITAATVMTVNMIINEYGMIGLAIATMLAGVLLIIMGCLRLGELLKYIPITLTTGFTAGIAIGIFTSQIKEFFGLTVENMPINILEKWIVFAKASETLTPLAVVIGSASIVILLVLPRITKKIPASIGMLVIMTVIVQIGKLQVNTVASVYGELPSNFPLLQMPQFSISMIRDLMMHSFTLAFLVAIVSLLSCVVTDGMIGEKHDSNTELIAQGLANVVCGLFGAAPIAGAVARSKSGIDNGGRSQVVGVVHCIVLVFFLLVMMPLIGYLPMPSLSGLLMVIAYQMINWKEIRYAVSSTTKADDIILLVTIAMAILFDLMVAIVMGFMASTLFFMKRMSDETKVDRWRRIEEEVEGNTEHLRELPHHTEVYEINGPLFFAAAEKILDTKPREGCKYLILRMGAVNAVDVTAMHKLEYVYEYCKQQGTTIILSHVQEQPLNEMKQTGFLKLIGEDNICTYLEDSLMRVEELEGNENK